jgi:glycosyltransferase involved in cell wall biosynthesis
MPERTIAYVLKGWPRRSELFIASEIGRLEHSGLPLRLYVLKRPDEDVHHEVVDRVAVNPTYLPPTTSLSQCPLSRWLRENLRPFLPALGRMLGRHPFRVARAAGTAAAQSVRARKGWRPRKIYIKELLQALAVADHVERAGDVAHLHAHFAHGTTTVTWLAAMVCRRPFSFTGHAKDLYVPSLNPAGLLSRKLRAAAFAVTCTGANADHLQRVEPSAVVHVVHHGLNADFARLLDGAPPRLTPDGFRIVSVGRMVPKKGFDVLIDAVAELRDRGLDADVVIAGEPGETAEALRTQLAERGLVDAVTIAGPVTQAELLALYRSANVFVLACRVSGDGDRDGIPNVLVEAMAAGLPVVSTTVSGIPEVVRDGDNGLLVQPDDPDALADAILRIAKDPESAAAMAEAGRVTIAEDFDGDALARRMAALFAEARR